MCVLVSIVCVCVCVCAQAIRASYRKQVELFWDPIRPTVIGLVWHSRGFSGGKPDTCLSHLTVSVVSGKGKKAKPAQLRLASSEPSSESVCGQLLAIVQDVVGRSNGVAMDAVLL